MILGQSVEGRKIERKQSVALGRFVYRNNLLRIIFIFLILLPPGINRVNLSVKNSAEEG
jgi:hypothetical protein